MSQPTSSQLPARKKRCSSAKGRMIAEALDSQLLEFARTGTPFTISKARDALLAQPELADHDKRQLRYHVRDRVKRLEEMGLATRVDVHGRNRPVYRLFPDDIDDALNEHEDSQDDAPASDTTSSTPSQTADTTSSTPSQTADRTCDVYTFLERDRHQLNTQMQAAISEAEYYQRVLSHYPHETARITPLLEEAIQRSGTLKGQWDANLMLRRELATKEGRA